MTINIETDLPNNIINFNSDIQKIDFIEYFNKGILAQTCPLDLVKKILNECDKDSKRIRLLPAPSVVYFVMAMNLWRDKDLEEVLKTVCAGLVAIDPSFRFDHGFPHRAAISRARSRLGAPVMERLAKSTLKFLAAPETESAFYKGLRVTAMDGISFDLADEKRIDEYFGRPSTSRGTSAYPQSKVLGLSEIYTRCIVNAVIGTCNESEMTMAIQLFRNSTLGPDILVLGDRGFYGYQIWKAFLNTGAMGLWRIKKNLITKPIIFFPDGSYLVNVYDSNNRKTCTPIRARIIEGEVIVTDENGNKTTEQYKFITNLFDYEKYPSNELIQLYHLRWEIEIGFKEIKETLCDNQPLRSKTPELVKQEIWGLIITHFAIRQLIYEAAKKKFKHPKDISCQGAVNVITRMLPLVVGIPDDKLFEWKDSLLDQIASSKCESYPGRSNQRAVKRKMSKFPVRQRGTPYNKKVTIRARVKVA